MDCTAESVGVPQEDIWMLPGYMQAWFTKAFRRCPLFLKRLAPWHLWHLQVVDDRELHALWEQQHLKRLFAAYGVDCVFDVGANNGQYATMLRHTVGFRGLVISFEPIPEVAASLRITSRRDASWFVEEIAIAEHDGTQSFHVMRDPQFSSLSRPRCDEATMLAERNGIETTTAVRTETLTTAFRRLQAIHGFRRPFLKLDTQGYDLRILQAAALTLPEFIGLQSELAVKRLYEDSVDYREALKAYERLGFTLSAFVPNNAGHFPILVETDCIMVQSRLLEGQR